MINYAVHEKGESGEMCRRKTDKRKNGTGKGKGDKMRSGKRKMFRMGMTFLWKSKMLTFSAFLSIFVACFLSISMFQLSSNVETSIVAGLEAKKGAFDLKITKDEGETFQNEELKELEQDKDVTGYSIGYQTDELSEAFAAGVSDDAINKSLYKYTKDVSGNRIVINDSLARRDNKSTGDSYLIAGKKFQIIEVIKTVSGSDYTMPMVVMELSQLHQLLGHNDPAHVNYILLQCDKEAFENVDYGGGIVHRIKKQHPDFVVSDQGAGEDYYALLRNIKKIFRIFFVVVYMISGLFVANIFLEYIRKYRKDMAVIRTIGGTQEQVQTIFSSMSFVISGCACLAGAMFSALVSGITLKWFNEKVQLFEGSAAINWKMLWFIAVFVFVLFNVLIGIVFSFGQNVLPIQVFEETSSGLKKSSKAHRFQLVRKMFGKEMYFAMKFMSSKLRQNFMMIVIIALITALAYTGQASLKLLKANDNWYNYNLVQRKTAKAEIYNDKPMSVSYAKKIYHRFQPVIGKGYMLYGTFGLNSEDEYDPDLNRFKVSDLETLPQLLNVSIWKNYKTVPKTKRVVMNETVASQCGYQLGDKVTLESDYFGGSRDFVLVELINGKTNCNDEYNIIVDWDNLSEKAASEDNTDRDYIGLWLDGDKELIRDKIQELQIELGSDTSFEWCIYDDVMEESVRICRQWTTSLHVVLVMLLIVSGIGLLNSANGMLLAKEKEYRILRMLGETKKSVHKICWFQVWSYMLSGVVLGALLGMIIVYGIWKGNVITNTPITVEWEYLIGIVMYLFGVSFVLYPTVRKM